jgi:hypothetical protein
MPKPERFDGYIRVSRRMGRKGPGYISPTVQREAIARWAEYRGVEIAAWHVDEDESGGTQDRPGLREAIQRIESGKTQGIACWRLNRFATSPARLRMSSAFSPSADISRSSRRTSIPPARSARRDCAGRTEHDAERTSATYEGRGGTVASAGPLVPARPLRRTFRRSWQRGRPPESRHSGTGQNHCGPHMRLSAGRARDTRNTP